MLKTTKQKEKSPIVEGVTERYDELYPVKLLTYGEDNSELYYDKDDSSYYVDLKSSISKYGLKTPILVYSTDEVKSGNTRLRACIELGYEYIPIVRSILEKPRDKFSNLMALQMENQDLVIFVDNIIKYVKQFQHMNKLMVKYVQLILLKKRFVQRLK